MFAQNKDNSFRGLGKRKSYPEVVTLRVNSSLVANLISYINDLILVPC